jgi:hypothetical protein
VGKQCILVRVHQLGQAFMIHGWLSLYFPEERSAELLSVLRFA